MNAFKPGSPRRLAHSRTILACLSTLPLLLVSGLAQAQFNFPICCIEAPFPRTTDENVAVGELSRMLPSAGIQRYTRYVGNFRWQTTHTLSLFAVTQRGISTRTWDSDSRDWTDWEHLGNPSGAPIERVSNSGDTPGMDFGLPLVRGWGVYDPDWLVFQGVAKTSSSSLPDFETARMGIDAPLRTLDYDGLSPTLTTASGPLLPSFWDYFNPHAGFDSTTATGASQRHMFGTGLPRAVVDSSNFAGEPQLPLIEVRQTTKSGMPDWISHGQPAGRYGVSVGAGSTTSVIHDYLNRDDPGDYEEQHYVFVATDPQIEGNTGINAGEIAYLRGDGEQFGWQSLGAPGDFVNGAPVATTYYTNVPILGGKGRIVVFAVARDGRGGWHLSTHYHDGDGWDSGWADQGAPQGLGGDKFRMTTSAVWYVGPSNDLGNLRISAFGYTDPTPNRNGQLVEFHWNGAYWQWMPLRSAPGGRGLRTDHAVVVDEGDKDRVTVFARTYDGRIYEFVREYDRAQVVGEEWNDLSTEPLFRLIGGLGSPRLGG